MEIWGSSYVNTVQKQSSDNESAVIYCARIWFKSGSEIMYCSLFFTLSVHHASFLENTYHHVLVNAHSISESFDADSFSK
jgi:hypothetical protein